MLFGKQFKSILFFSFWGVMLLATNTIKFVNAISNTASGSALYLHFEYNNQPSNTTTNLFTFANEIFENENDEDENDDNNKEFGLSTFVNQYYNISTINLVETKSKSNFANSIGLNASIHPPLYKLFCCWKNHLA